MNNRVILVILLFVFTVFLTNKFIVRYCKRIKNLLNLKKNGVQTVGKISDFIQDSDPDGVRLFLEVVEFNVDGENIRITAKVPVKQKPVIGARIGIVYNKDNPRDAAFNINKSLASLSMAIVIVVIVLAILFFLTIKSFFADQS